ncbi:MULTISPECIES: Xaa-Pro peptidase family protein [unclassified Sinorhizobium]|uniref:M24 family metallopeptidase n=1 Tax=unclassified Sinorhizobium TaxID=2613772 RepID=UPI0024C3AB44|nr:MULTISPECIES: Xaa-Pro peptidase family protein [unclassified Sinorhizobium]MDK1378273.1 Xaa-Pro peptidase family protein [Sinorhizobium sp. 6-70]MDK1482378.1 Xaa-Pro peptidase family protein [Sinorhizobium sp. 6-117]
MPIVKGPQVFPRAEFLSRLAAVKSEMERLEIDTLIVGNQTDINYLTGYTAKSAYVPQALVVSLKEEEPTFVLRRQDAPAAVHLTFMDRSKVIAYPETLIGNPDKDGFDAVIDFVNELDDAPRRGIGLQLGYLSIQSAEKFKSRLPNARIVDCTYSIAWIRMIKSDLEIAMMRDAAAIADAGILKASEVIRPGVREADVIAEIVAQLARGANGKAGTDLAPLYLCSSPRTGTCHIRWSEDVIRDGSQINLEIAGIRHGYVSAIMRTFSVGAPSDRLRRLHDAEVLGLEAAVASARPGATCSDVANAFYRTIEKSGFQKDSRCGYDIGIDWSEPCCASLQDGDMTVLKPNMTFHLMLGNWVDEDFGYIISETIRVTDSGCEVLTKSPRQLFEL